MTDETATSAQTDTDAANGNESATEASQETSQVTDQGGDNGSQSAAEADGNDGGTQTADDEKASQDKDQDEAEGEDVHGAPESYADLTLPEGAQVDEHSMGEVLGLAKDLDLSQAGAQQLADRLIALEQHRQGAFVESIVENHRQQNAEWVKEIKADKDLGGANFEKSMATARRPVQQFGDDALKALLEPFDPKENPTGLGLGNHPAWFRFSNRIGMAISEDNPGAEGEAGLTPQERLAKRYPNTKA